MTPIQLPSKQEIQRSLFLNPKINVTQYNLILIAENLANQTIFPSENLSYRILQCSLTQRNLVRLKQKDCRILATALKALGSQVKEKIS